jgi:hypothetical protein
MEFDSLQVHRCLQPQLSGQRSELQYLDDPFIVDLVLQRGMQYRLDLAG